MPSWWDAITPWDTDNERKQKEAEAKAKEAAAKALALQRAQERASQGPPTRRELVNQWAQQAKPVVTSDRLREQPTRPVTPLLEPVTPATPADPVQAWRDSAAQRAPLYEVQQPDFEIGPDRVDTGVSSIQSSAPINPTMGPPQGPARQQQPPRAWDAFSNAMGDWAVQPIANAARATGIDTALNRVGGVMGEGIPDWYTSQPAFIKAQADDEWRRSEGSNTGYDAFLDTAGGFLDQAFTVPAKSLLNAPIPGSGGALGLPGDVGLSDVAGAFGGYLNQSGLNPLNPNKKQYSEIQQDLWRQTSGQEGFYEASGIKSQLELAAKNRQLIDALPPELRNTASMALSSTISGAQNVRNTIDAILGQPERVQELYQLAQQAQTQGDALNAAEYGRQADELRKKSARDFVDENTNIWAEIVEGVLLDPTNLVGPLADAVGLSNEARTATKNLQLFDMTPEAAQQAIDSALPQVQKIADSINMGEMGKGWWARVNPFALTPDSAAHSSSNNIFRTASVLFGSVTDKQEAMAMAQNLVTNPAVLVAEGAAGPGLLANPDFLRDLPILHVAQEKIQNMRSLMGQGAFNPVEFLSELDNIVYQTARRANGLDDLAELPAGVAKLNLRRTQGGTGIIEYLDAKGKLISSSPEMVYYNAQQELKALNKAISAQGGGMTALRAHDQIQRAVMSDLWLNMRPAHWVRNALSATTTLLADNLYTLRPTADILDGLTARFGGAVPTQRLAEGAGGVQEMTGNQSIFRKLGPLGAPLAAWAEKGAQIWSGGTALGPGGRVAFGEQNFYLRAFSQPFERFLNENWSQVVSGEMAPILQSLGIDPAMARRLEEIAVDAGVTGNKADVAGALRTAVNKATTSPNLRELGISPDAFSLDAWKKINTLIQDGVPEDLPAIAQQLRTLVQTETDRLTRLINAAPPQPIRHAWTEAEQIEDGADMIDTLTTAAKRAGIDPAQAKQEASTFVQQVIQEERAALQTFRTELTTTGNPDSLNVAIDLWGQIDELKRVARAKVDQLGQQAMQGNTPELWQRKFQETRQIYTDLSQFMSRTIDQARTDVLALERGDKVPRRYDFWNMVDRYLGFDEIATREARLGGMDLKAPSADPLWKQVIAANRAYVDASTAEAFQAFRRYSSVDALDMIASAQKNIDRLGAQAAGYLAELSEQIPLGMMSKERYYAARNQVWSQFFDNAVLINKSATWEIVQDGLAAQTDTMLRWSDEFAGGEFKLIAPGKDGIWTAKRLDDGTIHQFADPTRGKPGDMASMPRVPQQVVNDYYRIMGEASKIVEVEIADIAQEVAQSIPIPQTVDELRKFVAATGLDQMGGDLASGIGESLRNSWRQSVQKSGTLPSTEVQANSLINQVYERMVRDGAPRDVATIDRAIDLVERAGNNAQQAQALYRAPAAVSAAVDDSVMSAEEMASYRTMDRGVVASMFGPELRDKGYTDVEIAKMSASDIVDSMAGSTYSAPEWVAARQQAIETANNDIAKLAQQQGLTPQEIEQKLYDFVRQSVDTSPVAYQIETKYIDNVLESGQIQNQFQSGVSTATFDPVARTRIEKRTLNIPDATPGNKRPVYGYLFMQRGEQNHIDAYGDITLLFDDSIKPGATFTVGDSADSFGPIAAAGVTTPGGEAIGSHAEDLWRLATDPAYQFDEEITPYIEIQMSGVNLSDVRQVLDPTSALTAEQVQKFVAQGIEVLQGEAASAPAMREYEMALPALDLDAIVKRMKAAAAKPYELIPLGKDAFNPWGLLSDKAQDARQVFGAINSGIKNTRQVTPEVGDAAAYMAANAQQAYQRIMQQLPDLLSGTPNAMTDAQRLRVIDAAQKLAAKHDDILAAAVKTGQDVADFAMLNYNQRRNFDVLLQLAIPYHYFWSRSAANWAKRVAQKPAIANFYYEMQRGIDAQNERDNIPQHLRSTIGIPGINYRIANPLPYMIPFASYGPSTFIDPNEAQTDAGRWINTVVQWSPGLLPTLDLARKYFVEGNLNDVSIGDYVPQYKLGGYGYQAATGNILGGPLSYTDEFEYGRAGKQVSLANVRGDIDKNTALWGQDVGLQQQTGAKPLPEQPPGAGDTWRQGAQDSAWNRLITTGAGYLTGLGVYPYSPEEQQIRAISGIRSDLGYDTASNLYGTQGAVNAFDEATGEVTDPYYAYRQMYPQDGSGYGQPIRPGEQAVNAEKKAAKAAISAQMGKDLDEYLKANPNATNSEIYDFKSTYYDQIDALDQKFPSATVYPDRPSVTTDATGYMNYAPTDFYNNYSPEELLSSAQQAAVYQVRDELADQKPIYPEGGTREQINQYYKDKEAYDAAIETRVQEYLDSPELLSSLVNGRSVLPGPARPGEQFGPPQTTNPPPLFPELGITGWDATKIKPPAPGGGATSAADIIRQVGESGQTDAEKAQRAKNAAAAEEKRKAGNAKWEQSQAEFAARRADVSGYFGEGGAAMWDEYYNLPKGPQRDEFIKNNPVMRAINLYAYNKAELAPGLELFGDDAFGQWALAPAYADTPEAKAARSKYWDDNPKAFLFHSWLNGRPSSEAETPGAGSRYNFGADYQEAQKLFGEDIWTIREGYKSSWDKNFKRAYYDKYPQLSEFMSWWYGSMGTGTATAAGTGAARTAGGGGTGTRSYGGGGGYYGGEAPAREQAVNIQMPYSRGLSNGLAEGGNSAPAAWRPSQADLRWLEAGRNLAPGKPKESKVDWIRKTGGTY